MMPLLPLIVALTGCGSENNSLEADLHEAYINGFDFIDESEERNLKENPNYLSEAKHQIIDFAQTALQDDYLDEQETQALIDLGASESELAKYDWHYAWTKQSLNRLTGWVKPNEEEIIHLLSEIYKLDLSRLSYEEKFSYAQLIENEILIKWQLNEDIASEALLVYGEICGNRPIPEFFYEIIDSENEALISNLLTCVASFPAQNAIPFFVTALSRNSGDVEIWLITLAAQSLAHIATVDNLSEILSEVHELPFSTNKVFYSKFLTEAKNVNPEIIASFWNWALELPFEEFKSAFLLSKASLPIDELTKDRLIAFMDDAQYDNQSISIALFLLKQPSLNEEHLSAIEALFYRSQSIDSVYNFGNALFLFFEKENKGFSFLQKVILEGSVPQKKWAKEKITSYLESLSEENLATALSQIQTPIHLGFTEALSSTVIEEASLARRYFLARKNKEDFVKVLGTLSNEETAKDFFQSQSLSPIQKDWLWENRQITALIPHKAYSVCFTWPELEQKILETDSISEKKEIIQLVQLKEILTNSNPPHTIIELICDFINTSEDTVDSKVEIYLQFQKRLEARYWDQIEPWLNNLPGSPFVQISENWNSSLLPIQLQRFLEKLLNNSVKEKRIKATKLLAPYQGLRIHNQLASINPDYLDEILLAFYELNPSDLGQASDDLLIGFYLNHDEVTSEWVAQHTSYAKLNEFLLQENISNEKIIRLLEAMKRFTRLNSDNIKKPIEIWLDENRSPAVHQAAEEFFLAQPQDIVASSLFAILSQNPSSASTLKIMTHLNSLESTFNRSALEAIQSYLNDPNARIREQARIFLLKNDSSRLITFLDDKAYLFRTEIYDALTAAESDQVASTRSVTARPILVNPTVEHIETAAGSFSKLKLDDHLGTYPYSPKMIFDHQNNLHIVYRSDTDNEIRYIVRNASGQFTRYDLGEAFNKGDYPSDLFVDSNNQVHFSFVNSETKKIHYAVGNETNWQVTNVAPRQAITNQTAMAMDSENEPHIFSFNSRSGKLTETELSAGRWMTSEIPTDVTFPILYPCLAEALTIGSKIYVASTDTNNTLQVFVNSGSGWAGHATLPNSQSYRTPQLFLETNLSTSPSILYESSSTGLMLARPSRSGYQTNQVAPHGQSNFFEPTTLSRMSQLSEIYYFDEDSDDLIHAEISGGLWMSTPLTNTTDRNQLEGLAPYTVKDSQGKDLVIYIKTDNRDGSLILLTED